MILTRLLLNPDKPKTAMAIANPNIFHGALSSLQNHREDRLLWRVDPLNGKRYLLTLSQEPLDTTPLIAQFGYPDSPAQWKNYQPLLDRVKEGSCWQFRLCANPTISLKRFRGDTQRGKVISPISEEQKMDWLLHKGETNGFQVVPGSVSVLESKWVRFVKDKASNDRKSVTLQEVTYQGLLIVTDPERFKQCLISGLGRSKAYGMGLLTIVKPR